MAESVMDKYSEVQLRRLHMLLKEAASLKPDEADAITRWPVHAGRLEARIHLAVQILEEYFGIKE